MFIKSVILIPKNKSKMMEAIKIKRKINSKNLHINELEDLIGKEAEIIILPIEEGRRSSMENILKLAGSIKSGENPDSFQKRLRREWDKKA